MFRLSKSVLSFGVGALALGVLILAAPRASHALAAAFVVVTNTAADPVITQSTNAQASQLVELQLPLGSPLPPNSGAIAMSQVSIPSGQSTTPYVVPAGQHLVITGMDINVYGGASFVQLYLPSNLGNFAVSTAYLPNVGLQQIRYPSGIVAPAGSNVFVQTGGGASGSSVDVTIYGYLTAK